MLHPYSLVHLTNIACPPPEFIRTAARAGYDAVSLRTIPMGLPGETPYNMAKDRQLLQDTKLALSETGIRYQDTEVARIADGVDVTTYEPSLAVAAELGVTQILTNIWTAERSQYTDQFCTLCALAAQYGQTVNVEFVTWASVADLKDTKALLRAAGQENVGIVVDTLHFYRSRVAPEELDDCPAGWFHYAHLCDCEREIPSDLESLTHCARAERLYPGEGAIQIREIISRIPNQDIIYGIELPHTARLKELGFEEHARRALRAAKTCMGE